LNHNAFATPSPTERNRDGNGDPNRTPLSAAQKSHISSQFSNIFKKKNSSMRIAECGGDEEEDEIHGETEEMYDDDTDTFNENEGGGNDGKVLT
jgi:hypothetical protein